MVIAERDIGHLLSGNRRFISVNVTAIAAMAVIAGCSHYKPPQTYFSDQSRTQIQFYSPPGATISVIEESDTRTRQVAQYGPLQHRLEHAPEEFSVFNLKPGGRYEFKYVSADGLPGVSVYGELNVYYTNSHEARVFQRRAFVPITLPSAYYKRAEVNGDEIFPYRAEAYRTAIDEQDLQRLKQGDVIEKVFVVADLEKAEKLRKKTEEKIVVCEREIEYAEARFRQAYLDYRIDVADPMANFLGTDRGFIHWEKKRKELEHELESLQARLRRTKALLKGDHVLVRKGMLVLATEGVVEPYRDVVDAAEDLGEVLLVMRIGGRHMQWGAPQRELAVYQQ